MATATKLEIDQKIIDATECDKGFACLRDRTVYCSVVSTLGHALVRLECRESLVCRHNKAYGALQACNCRVRHEIFTKYGK